MSVQLTESFSVPNTLGCPSTASLGGRATNREQLLSLINQSLDLGVKPLIVGQGSNILADKQVQGVVIVAEGGDISFDGTSVVADAGVAWQKIVDASIGRGLRGLENLTAIPGTVGASPIQNIGAYGVEVAEFITQVSFYDFDERRVISLTNDDCQFGYRDSIFKRALAGKGAIISVSYQLSIERPFTIDYGPLAALASDTLSAAELAGHIEDIRWSKLPRPSALPNAGSFFKNPIVDNSLLELNDDLGIDLGPKFELENGLIKLSAGWLIDQLGYRGRFVGACKMYDNHALVLTNPDCASLSSVLALADDIVSNVKLRYGVTLEVEPRRLH